MTTLLIVNCEGLGDGLIELPFLKAMEVKAPSVRYFHTDGRLFRDSSFLSTLRLKGLAGLVPPDWRKFRPEDWPDISRFIQQRRVDAIVNFRHIGPRFDTGYFEYKLRAQHDLQFFDIPFPPPSPPQNIRDRLHALLEGAGLVEPRIDLLWLRTLAARRRSTDTGYLVVNTHAGNVFKTWPTSKWLALCKALIARKRRLRVLSGHSCQEARVAESLASGLEAFAPGLVELSDSSNLLSCLHELSGSDGLISGDSWPVHAATGLGVPTVGLYLVTSPDLWGGHGPDFRPVVSRHLRRCDNYDPDLGICRNGYVACADVQRNGDGLSVEEVLEMSQALLAG